MSDLQQPHATVLCSLNVSEYARTCTARPIRTANSAMLHANTCEQEWSKFCQYINRKLVCRSIWFGQSFLGIFVRHAKHTTQKCMGANWISSKHRWTQAILHSSAWCRLCLHGTEQLLWTKLKNLCNPIDVSIYFIWIKTLHWSVVYTSVQVAATLVTSIWVASMNDQVPHSQRHSN